MLPAAAALGAVLAVAAAPVRAEPPKGAEGGTLLLDESAYWRYYLQGNPARISAAMMKKDAARLVPERQLKEIERRHLSRLAAAGRKGDDWHKELRYDTYLNLNWFNDPRVKSSPPPEDWTKPEFDDSDWSRYRKPFKMGKDFRADGYVNHFYQVHPVHFRSALEVPDPRGAGDLHLRLVYRGGIRVFFNGEELARGHLPEGKLAPDTPAEAYPSEAYYLLDGEHPDHVPGRKHPPRCLVGNKVYIVGDLDAFARSPRFEELPKAKAPGGPYADTRGLGLGIKDAFVTRAGWDRIMKLRNRVLEVPIPAAKVRKGTNVVALELRASELGPVSLIWSVPWVGSGAWKHGWLMECQLRASGRGVPSPLRRPPGVQVWVEDIHHRLFSPEFCPPGRPPRRVRIIAARNGTFGAQIAVGTDRQLDGLTVTVSGFRGPGRARPDGASLPASIARVSYMVGHPSWEIGTLGRGKGAGEGAGPGFSWYSSECSIILNRHSSVKGIMRAAQGEQAKQAKQQLRERELKRIDFFDHLRAAPPEGIPAGTCQPVWISVTVPESAAPGTYRATVKVAPAGAEAVELPLELEVADWALPEPRGFQAIVALEQSPYAIARHYKVRAWSKEHFRLMKPSYELLSKVGNDVLIVPVIAKTEFGNSTDSPLGVIRGADGQLRLDFAVVDRYLDLAVSHWGVPRCVAFVVDHSDRQVVAVPVADERTGKRELVDIGPKAPESRRRGVWRLLATGIYGHMKARGMAKSTFWGLHGDGVNDPSLVKLLKEFVPDVPWVRYSHRYSPDQDYQFCATVRVPSQHLPPTSRRGWMTSPDRINLWIPRHWNGIAVCWGTSSPFAYRLGIERALVSGAPGMGRVGADYWDRTWLHDFPRCPYCGMPLLSVFWPGKEGAESSARFEVLREGVQETEARIFLEQAKGKLDDPALEKDIAAVLRQRHHDTLFALVFTPHAKIEEYSSGWQGRSRRLYGAAARAARRLGVDLARTSLAAGIPARGKTRVKVKLRNWTGKPRAWKLSADRPWIVPERTSGRVSGRDGRVGVTLDAAGLEPGEPVAGRLTLTDVETGRTESMALSADVSDVMVLSGGHRAVNLACGVKRELTFDLLNPSGKPLRWRLTPSVGWVKAEPPAGTLPPGRRCVVRVALRPPDLRRARHETALLLTETGGAECRRRLVVHVMPHYIQPRSRPAGAGVAMDSLGTKRLSRYALAGKALDMRRHRFAFHDPKNPGPARGGLKIGRKSFGDWNSFLKEYKRGFLLQPGYEITLDVRGLGVRSFAAEVGWLSASRMAPESRDMPKLYFEVYVDGELKAHSGPMGLTDPPRLVAVDALAGAKEVRFLLRCHDDRLNDRKLSVWGVWGEPAFYK